MSKTELPKGILAGDLKYPTYNEKTGSRCVAMFELWKTDRGWVIPTLPISGRGASFRTYSVGIADEKIYTVGNGPHVTAKHTIYVSTARHKALQKFLELKTKGEGTANSIRDRISTRRAQGQLYRAGW